MPGGPILGRRRFLEWSLGAATAVFVGPIVPKKPSARVANPFPVEDDAWAVMRAVTEAVAPEGEGFPRAVDLELRPYFENLMGQMEKPDRDQFLSLLTLIQYSTLLSHFTRFTVLAVEDRREALAGWRDSSLTLRRQAYAGLKMTAAMVYFADDATWGPTGYDGPWLEQTEIPVLDPPPLGSYRNDTGTDGA